MSYSAGCFIWSKLPFFCMLGIFTENVIHLYWCTWRLTWYNLTYSDFPTNQTFHRFHDLYAKRNLYRLWVVSMEHLQRVWHASRERLFFQKPGSVPHWWTCSCSNCWDQIPRTCHVFTRLFTSNTPWYLLHFALNIHIFPMEYIIESSYLVWWYIIIFLIHSSTQWCLMILTIIFNVIDIRYKYNAFISDLG